LEMNESALFHTTVPSLPLEIEGTGGTEVIVRHGRERRVEDRRAWPGHVKGGHVHCSTLDTRLRLDGCVLSSTTHRFSATTHPLLHPHNCLSLSFLYLLAMEK